MMVLSISQISFPIWVEFLIGQFILEVTFSIRLRYLRWVPKVHCAGRRGLNLLTVLRLAQSLSLRPNGVSKAQRRDIIYLTGRKNHEEISCKHLSNVYGKFVQYYATVTSRLQEFRKRRNDVKDEHHSGCQIMPGSWRKCPESPPSDAWKKNRYGEYSSGNKPANAYRLYSLT